MDARQAIQAAQEYELNDDLSNLPRAGSKLLRALASVDELSSLVDDYCEIVRADYESGEDGTEEYRADREMAWDDLVRSCECIDDDDEI